MEELAKELRRKITDICFSYIFLKQTDVIEKVIPLTGDIQEFLKRFIQKDVSEIDEEEYQVLVNYAAGVAKDYVEAIEQRDMVLMVDTLDYGLRELFNIYIPSMEEG